MSLPVILVVDDDRAFRSNLVRLCRQTERDRDLAFDAVQEAGSFDEACELIVKLKPDVLFLDFMLPHISGKQVTDCGFDLLHRALDANPLAEAIMMSAVRDDASSAVEALTERGAFYFFVKERLDTRQLQRVLYQALEKLRLARENQKVRQRPKYYMVGAEISSPLATMVGSCDAIEHTRKVVRRVAQGATNVLVTGETGTGKELIARAVHYHSPRRSEPFVAVNCSAVPEALWESQFFGHVRGAFTGAHRDQPGFLDEAQKGTLFLDEAGDIPLSCQAKLLRAIEDREFRPVGSSQTRQMDTRIVSATKRNLKDMMSRGEYRDDLYYRLEGFQISVPPIRDRGNDILEIAEVLVARHLEATGKREIHLESEATTVLLGYDWPGNVRELANVVERCILMLDDGQAITRQVLLDCGPFQVQREKLRLRLVGQEIKSAVAKWRHADDESFKASLEVEICRVLREAFSKAKGNVSHASQLLGLSRSTSYSYLRTFGFLED